ncbi:putative repeat protein (TIGR01451 family) [Arcicella aurantiaca]|uniref:Putative repeat protein (TIGR01451 family) n=1 Tax=Arcicella aurantiaca TaxID=591202 RepID=A0A316DK35_9BACT|nr:DUF11 domain-containing protein [Arcicella aurantiaca]PWK17629.1 putative repeat protein (TIGR01451 family) [Arcicella aurantiaca]
MNHIYTLAYGQDIVPRMAKSLILFLVMVLFFIPTKSLNAQTGTCNFKAGNVTLVLSGQSTGSNITSQLVLTNATGVIQYVSAANNTTLNNVTAGSYLAYGITYDASTNPNLAVGGNVNSVGFCYKTTSIPLNVCDCNNASGILSASVSGQTSIAGQVNKYVLTDGKGQILAIDNVPTFTGYGNGVYNIYGVSYDGNGTVNGLAVNNNISGVSGSCVSVTTGTGYIVCLPALVVSKAGPTTGTVGSNYNYTLSVSNNGVAPTSGVVTVTDVLPSGLTFVSGSGNGWSCAANGQTVTCTTSSSILPASSASIINLTVTPTQTGSFNNTASVSGGGDNTPSTSNSVNTVVSNPATPNLVISKSGPATGTVGVNFDYSLIVNNTGTAATNGGLVTVTDIIPTGLTFVSGTGTGWTCSASGQTVTCITNNVISVNGGSNITLTVNPTATGTVNNTANVVGGGDNTSSTSNLVTTVINAAPMPNLTLIKTGPSTATVGTNFTYTLTVNNTGTAPTNGLVSVTDAIPAGLSFVSATGSGWVCSAVGQNMTCTTNNPILVNGSSSIVLTVNPLSSGAVVNNASVVGGGDSTPSISNDVNTTINEAPTPNLVISKSGPVTGTVGTNYNYTLTINNTGTVATTGTITVTDALPAGLTFVSGSGTGWSCSGVGQTVTCTSTTAIIVNGTSTINLIVTPTQTGTYVNVASVTGGGDKTSSTSNSVTTQINPAPTPNLAMVKAGPTTATVGVNYNYTLTVSNTGTSNTNGQIVVSDVLPTGLNFVSGNGSGWSCSAVGQTVTCITNNAIAVGANSVITLVVNPVLSGNYNNTASVNGGGTTGNTNSNTVNTNVGCPTNINPGVLKY